MIKSHAEQDELDFDTQQGQWKIFDDTFNSIMLDTVEDLEPERFKRPDGTYTDGPSLKQFAAGMTFEMYQENRARIK